MSVRLDAFIVRRSSDPGAGQVGEIGYRRASKTDAAALGALHVASWRETYFRLLPARLLDSLSVAARAAMWSSILGDPAVMRETAIWVAEDADRMVGFGACGGQRDEGLKREGYDGELGAIYVLQSHQRGGVGRSLMGHMAQALVDQGRSGASLWVLRENAPARSFYERLGGAVVGARSAEEWGTTLSELAYGWSDLSPLVGALPPCRER